MDINEPILQNRLGLRSDLQAYTLHAPFDYDKLLSSPTPLTDIAKLSINLDWLQAFYTDSAKLEEEINLLKNSLKKTGQLWICWPKKLSKVTSDLSDNIVRQIGLSSGLVDVKVAAINDTWSGLKFVYRASDR